jgi:hypothetical protein
LSVQAKFCNRCGNPQWFEFVRISQAIK